MLTGIWKHSATIHNFRNINKSRTDVHFLIDKMFLPSSKSETHEGLQVLLFSLCPSVCAIIQSHVKKIFSPFLGCSVCSIKGRCPLLITVLDFYVLIL